MAAAPPLDAAPAASLIAGAAATHPAGLGCVGSAAAGCPSLAAPAGSGSGAAAERAKLAAAELQELRAAAAELQRRRAMAREAVAEAKAIFGEEASALMFQACDVSQSLRTLSLEGPDVEHEERELERRIADLRRQEADRQALGLERVAKMNQELRALEEQAEASEQAEATAVRRLDERLPSLREEVLAIDRRLEARELRQDHDWCGSSRDGRSREAGLSAMELDSREWDRRLRAVLAPVAMVGGDGEQPLQGIRRLDAELGRMTVGDKERLAAPFVSFQRLSLDGPLGAAVVEFREAYACAVRLRDCNDAFAKELGGQGSRALSPAALSTTNATAFRLGRERSTPASEVVTQPHMPRGPRFQSPMAAGARQRRTSRPAAEESGVASATPIPKAVLTDRKEWEAAGHEKPRAPDEQGLAFLCKTSAQRFRPGSRVPAPSFDFELSELDAAAAEAELAACPRPATNPGEVARLAEAFQEPLSEALRCSRPSRA